MDPVSQNRKREPEEQPDLFEREKAQVLNSVDDLIVFQDRDMKILWANRPAEISADSPPGGLVGKRCWEIWHGRSTPCAGCPVAITLETGEAHTAEISSPDDRLWYIRSYPIKSARGAIEGVAEICQDVTERKLTEEALRENKERFKAVFDRAAVGIAIADTEGYLVDSNPVYQEMLGYTREELRHKKIYDVTHPDDVNKSREFERRLKEGSVDEYYLEKRYIRKDGRPIWSKVNVSAIRNQDGTLKYNLGVVEEISGHKRAEEALRRSEAGLRKSQEIAHLGSWELDLATNQLSWSDEVYRIFGMRPQEFGATYETFLDVVHPDDRAAVDEAYSSSVRDGRDSYEIEHRVVRKATGEVRIVYEKCEHVRDRSGRIIRSTGIVHDITERRRTEEAMKAAKAQAELYLDLMGHDINNMHQIALGYLEVAREMPPGEDPGEFLDKSIEVLQRSTQLIKNVRKLQKLHDGLFQSEIVDLAAVLADVRREFGGMPRKSIKLNVSGCVHCHVRANELLHDVFANLVSNAIKHTGDRADIVIDLDSVEVNGHRYYRVAVADNGPGIPDDFKDKIFNRMLKGTEKAKGMGLGLHLVRSLVDSYRGRVWAEDRVPGDHTRGARFVVILPDAGQ